jgi:hypothetical protein
MCSHSQAIKDRESYAKHFGVERPADVGKHDVWPCYPATFIRRSWQADVPPKIDILKTLILVYLRPLF